jgi:hypothetical protein
MTGWAADLRINVIFFSFKYEVKIEIQYYTTSGGGSLQAGGGSSAGGARQALHPRHQEGAHHSPGTRTVLRKLYLEIYSIYCGGMVCLQGVPFLFS